MDASFEHESVTACGFCGDPLEPRQRRFCSKRCSDGWRGTVQSGKPFKCPGCERTVLIPAKKWAGRKHCTRACATRTYNVRFGVKEGNHNWRGGRALPYGAGWRLIKEQVRLRDEVCRYCGRTPEDNGRALDVHHVDPFRFSGNNSVDNLIALCRRCHARADDHGRRGSAAFLAKAGRPKQPSKRELRKRAAAERARRKTEQRAELQRYAFRLHALGRSLREIARATGVSHQTVANWLSGSVRRQVPGGNGVSESSPRYVTSRRRSMKTFDVSASAA